MITLTGIAKFHLDCREMDAEIKVQCDVVCGWDREASAADMISLSPSLVSLTVGGVLVMEDEPFANLYGKLKGYIAVKCADLGFEAVGITDKEVVEALGNVEDWRAHEREHAAGRV